MQKEDDSRREDAAADGLAPEFAALLRCPNCPERPPLTYRTAAKALDCGVCGRRYPVADGLPDLRAEPAVKVAAEESAPGES